MSNRLPNKGEEAAWIKKTKKTTRSRVTLAEDSEITRCGWESSRPAPLSFSSSVYAVFALRSLSYAGYTYDMEDGSQFESDYESSYDCDGVVCDDFEPYLAYPSEVSFNGAIMGTDCVSLQSSPFGITYAEGQLDYSDVEAIRGALYRLEIYDPQEPVSDGAYAAGRAVILDLLTRDTCSAAGIAYWVGMLPHYDLSEEFVPSGTREMAIYQEDPSFGWIMRSSVLDVLIHCPNWSFIHATAETDPRIHIRAYTPAFDDIVWAELICRKSTTWKIQADRV